MFRQSVVLRPWLILAALLFSSSLSARAGISPENGHHVFMRSGCFACHGELGYGGAGPRFRGDKLLSADQYVVTQILLGRGIMPGYADRLNDRQIAAVASYVRNSWGNNFGPVTAEQVAEIRKSIAPGDAVQSSQ